MSKPADGQYRTAPSSAPPIVRRAPPAYLQQSCKVAAATTAAHNPAVAGLLSGNFGGETSIVLAGPLLPVNPAIVSALLASPAAVIGPCCGLSCRGCSSCGGRGGFSRDAGPPAQPTGA